MVLKPAEIDPPFSAATLSQGRKTAALTSTVVALAWLPGIDPTQFKIFGFELTTDNEHSLWILLGVAASYFMIVFLVNVITEYTLWVHNSRETPTWFLYLGIRENNKWTLLISKYYFITEDQDDDFHYVAVTDSTDLDDTIRLRIKTIIRVRQLFLKAWFLEMGVPVLLYIFAAVAIFNPNYFDPAPATQKPAIEQGASSLRGPD